MVFRAQNQLFRERRGRLAIWYAGVMGGILSISALGMYEAIAHAHRITIDREVESVAGTLHDSIEPLLKEPGKLEPEINQLVPNLCLLTAPCFHSTIDNPRHIASQINLSDNYYIHFVNISGELMAIAGNFIPASVRLTETEPQWYTLKDNQNIRYRQITLPLHTRDNQDWGYLQIGRNQSDFDDYVRTVRWIILVGLPLIMLLVGIASWWLAALAMEPIYQSYQQMQQFTADAAHELRTSLAAVGATVESSLQLPSLNEDEARCTLEVVQRQNNRLSQLVGDLLLLARMERPDLPVATGELIILQDIVNDIAEELAALAREANVELVVDFNLSSELQVRGNEVQLYRMVANLVTNAINYTPREGKVTLILERCHGFALIKVKDTGIGIGMEDKSRIFERFYRAREDRSRKTARRGAEAGRILQALETPREPCYPLGLCVGGSFFGGFGLGLPIAKAISNSHGGSIEVESELDKGSTFTVRLPIYSTIHKDLSSC